MGYVAISEVPADGPAPFDHAAPRTVESGDGAARFGVVAISRNPLVYAWTPAARTAALRAGYLSRRARLMTTGAEDAAAEKGIYYAPHSEALRALNAEAMLDFEISEVLEDGTAPFDFGPLSPAELDAAVTTALMPDVKCQPEADDGITEVHPSMPRARGESSKRRKRSRRPGDQRHKSQ